VAYPDGSVATKVCSSIGLWFGRHAQNVLHSRYHTQMLYARRIYCTILTSTDPIPHHSSRHVPEVATALGTLHRTILLVSHMTLRGTERPHLDLVERNLNHQIPPWTSRSSGFITTLTMSQEQAREGECNVLVSLDPQLLTVTDLVPSCSQE
jgi:hypothetical protein